MGSERAPPLITVVLTLVWMQACICCFRMAVITPTAFSPIQKGLTLLLQHLFDMPTRGHVYEEEGVPWIGRLGYPGTNLPLALLHSSHMLSHKAIIVADTVFCVWVGWIIS